MTPLKCPRCERDLTVQRVQGTNVHGCPSCSGIFLDRGELNRVAEPTPGDLEFSTVDLDTFDHLDAYGPASCPRCESSTMRKVEFVIYTNLILDYCEECQGFWLDGPELDRINEEVRKLNDAARDARTPPMLWFAYFIWSLPH